MTNSLVMPKVPGRVANAPPASEGAMESAEHTRLSEDASRERAPEAARREADGLTSRRGGRRS